jgi:vacuolar protein 8
LTFLSLTHSLSLLPDSQTASGDYSAFRNVWKEPNGGMQQYLYNFLKSVDATFQHIAVWTIVQLLESGDAELIRNIRNSALLDAPIRMLASSPTPSVPSSVGTPRSDRSSSRSSAGTHSGEGQGEGQGEIRLLARRILEFVDGDIDGGIPRSATTSHMGGSSVSSVRDEELRRSVREAFSSGSHH